jgi:Na+-driven multidrug efflux pump
LIRPDLRFRRLLPVWAPLALTFLLVAGSTPVVNASINRLPSPTRLEELAAFAVLLRLVILLHSPLFVTREIAIKLSVDRAGSRRALRICGAAGVSVALLEVVLALTPLGYEVLSRLASQPELAARAHRALLAVVPIPVLIAVRGVYQAHQIRVDDTLFVGLGTLVRLAFVAVLGLAVAPRLGIDGPLLGGLCLSLGMAVETLFAVLRGRARARPPEHAPAGTPRLSFLGFALPLMLANLLSVGPQVLYLKMAGRVAAEHAKTSLGAFQELVALQWLFTAGTLSLQSLTTAKVRARPDARRMLHFGLWIGAVLSVILALICFTPLRSWFLIDVLGQKDPAVREAVRQAMLICAWMPLFMAVRFTLRGILIARGRTYPISAAMVSSLILLSAALAFDLPPATTNGVWNAYVWWNAALVLEVAILAWAARRADRLGLGLPAVEKSPREFTGG